MAITKTENATGAMIARAKYKAARIRTEVQRRSNIRTARSCFMVDAQVLARFVADVRKLCGSYHCAKQKPEAESKNSNLNEHGEDQGHEA